MTRLWIVVMLGCSGPSRPSQPVLPPPPPDAAPVVQVPPDAPAEPPGPPPPNDCDSVAAHIATLIIEGEQDPTTRGAIEQERDRLVGKVKATCEGKPWSEAHRTCLARAKSTAEVDACAKTAPP